MKQYHSIVVFLVLTLSTALASIGSYEATDRRINNDLNQALAETLREKQSDVITADTISTFNSHLQIAELRGRAIIAVNSQQDRLQIKAHCSAATVFSISDQRPAALLATLSLLWLCLCAWRKRQPVVVAAGQTLGGLTYSETDSRFYDSAGSPVRLTPMQQQLMEMFFRKASHELTKQEICDALWPKKPDASETLYTLIRRLKPIVEEQAGLKIESERGRAYRLTE